MKNVLICAIVALLTGCGVAEHLGNGCGGDLKELCYNVFGGRLDHDQQDQINVHSGQIDDLQRQEDALNTALSHIQLQMDALGTQALSLQSQIAALFSQDTTQNTEISALQLSLNTANTEIAVLQTQNNSFLVQLATLAGYLNIVDLFDPCGPQGSYNEVFLHLANGKYIASLSENGSALTTRFVVLQDGSYITTDSTHCYFTVSGNGAHISGEHN